METKPVYFFRKKTIENGKTYIVVSDKPAIIIKELAGLPVGIRQQGLKFGTIPLNKIIGDYSFEFGDLLPGFSFTEQIVEGTENLYVISQVK
ncbi:MAG: hypothetical protein O2993_07630 [Bacteroidetes bacterium]|nr:hypothetical protein [Bacteroidota bacterium]